MATQRFSLSATPAKTEPASNAQIVWNLADWYGFIAHKTDCDLMIDPEFRNRLIPAVFGALATIVGLVELGSTGGSLDSRAVLIAVIAGLLCLATHCFSVFEFSTSIVASQIALGFIATVQIALVGSSKVEASAEYLPVVWVVLATPALHLGLRVQQSGRWPDRLYPVIAMVFGALAPSGLLWFVEANLARVQFSVAVGLASVVAAVLVARIDEPEPEPERSLVR